MYLDHLYFFDDARYVVRTFRRLARLLFDMSNAYDKSLRQTALAIKATCRRAAFAYMPGRSTRKRLRRSARCAQRRRGGVSTVAGGDCCGSAVCGPLGISCITNPGGGISSPAFGRRCDRNSCPALRGFYPPAVRHPYKNLAYNRLLVSYNGMTTRAVFHLGGQDMKSNRQGDFIHGAAILAVRL